MTGQVKRTFVVGGVLALAALCMFSAAQGLGQVPGNAPTGAKKLTIDRLYSLPWVIGTKPEGPAWSPDSRKLAFLWNNEGTNFLDVWVVDRESGKPVRVTSMPRPENPDNPGMDVALLEQQARAESDHGVSEVAWAPDGKSLVFTFKGKLYGVAASGGIPRRLTEGQGSERNPVAAPKGNRLAYLSGGGLWVMSFDGAAPSVKEVYAPGRPKVSASQIVWSPDGSKLAFVEADGTKVPIRGIPNYLGPETTLTPAKRPFPGEPSDEHRLGIVGVGGGQPQWAKLGADPLDLIFGVSWSPDGNTLLVDKSDLYIKDRRLLLVDSSTGEAKPLLEEKDPKNVTAEWWSGWAPDGRGIFYTSDRVYDYQVYYEGLAGGEPKAVTAGKFAVFAAELPAAGKALFVVTNEGHPEERQVFRVPLNGGTPGGKPERVTQQPGTHTPVVSPDGKTVADIFSSDSTPPDLYLEAAEAGGGFQGQVTHSPLPEFAQYHWVTPKYVDFPNVNDGTMVHARLTLPPDFDPAKKYPAILGSVYSNTARNQWGGRIPHPTWGLDQYLAQQGYVLLNVDISGSSGHGKAFRQRLALSYGGVDVDDLYSGVRYLVAQGFVDEKRVGIWGSSYGGLLTTMSMFRYPGVYQAGVAGAPATSLFHAMTGEMRTMMAPQDHMKEYTAASSFLRSGGLQGHLMIIQGMKDETVLFKDSVTLVQRLILQGKDVDLVVIPNAPHGWDTEGLAQTRFAYKKLVDYFARYLGGAK